MNRELFLKLATQFFVPNPDYYESERQRIQEHVLKVQANIYDKIEAEVDNTGKLPYIPTLTEIYEEAWSQYEKSI